MDYSKLEYLSFDFPKRLNIDGVVEHLLDELCGKYDTNVKDYDVEIYQQFYAEYYNVKMDNGMVFEFSIGFDDEDEEEPWWANVWIIKQSESA